MKRGQLLDKLITTIPVLLLLVLLLAGFFALAFVARAHVAETKGVSLTRSASLLMQPLLFSDTLIPLVQAIREVREGTRTREAFRSSLAQLTLPETCLFISWRPIAEPALATASSRFLHPSFGVFFVDATGTMHVEHELSGTLARTYTSRAFQLPVRVSLAGTEEEMLVLSYWGNCV
jgi:hypothetical protein